MRAAAPACAVLLWWAVAAWAVAEEPGNPPIEQVVDAEIGRKLESAGVQPAGPADDATLIRRLTLDLAGRIPTTSEAKEYAASTSPTKRIEAVDRLLASPDSPRHERNFLDTLLMLKEEGPFRDYLLKTCEQNLPWDQRFRDIMTAAEDDADKKGALAFLKARARNVDDLTRDTARLFFGVDISCAKCHDHPLVSDWKQDHYFGIAAFFSRTYMDKDRLSEKDKGEFKFKTKGGEEKVANLVFLTGEKFDEPAGGNRRALLADIALQPERNRFFSRSIVNRLWARFMGRGLVMPIDQMHSESPPSHPELLDWLAKDMVAHGYDLKRLVRGLVLSEAYARSSRWEGPGDPPAPQLFALASVRPLAPRQYATSLVVATSDPETISQQASGGDWAKRVADLEGRAGGFSGQIEVPDENFQVGVGEALLLSNSQQVEKNFLAEGGDRLLTRLKSIPDRREMITTAYWAVLSRAPAPEELQAIETYLTAREDRPEQARSQMVWALLTSAEFRFNY